LKVQIIASEKMMPVYGSKQAAGMDLRADITSNVTLRPGERKLFKTGVKIALEEGYEARIQPRSGLALNHGITITNSPGCVDADFRDEIGVILQNTSDTDYVVYPEERIAQMIISKVERPEIVVVTEFSEEVMKDDRGGGFGHTGTQEIIEKPKRKPKTRKTKSDGKASGK
jgi:dUTP pyrophosphatase